MTFIYLTVFRNIFCHDLNFLFIIRILVDSNSFKKNKTKHKLFLLKIMCLSLRLSPILFFCFQRIVFVLFISNVIKKKTGVLSCAKLIKDTIYRKACFKKKSTFRQASQKFLQDAGVGWLSVFLDH